jgi:O-antigen/teichoic acid export membrane protein
VDDPAALRFERFAGTGAARAELKQRSVRGALFVAAGGATDFVVRFGAIAVLARLLRPEDFGLIAMVTAVTSVVEGFRDLGLATATVQRPGITHRQVSNLFWVNAAAGAAFALAFCALSPVIASFFHEPRLVAIAVVLSLAFVWGGLSAQHEALMSRQLKQGELSFIRLAATLACTAAAVLLAWRGFGYWALVWREVIRTGLVSVGIWARCPWVPGWPCRGAGTGALIRFGTQLSATHLLTSLIASVDRLLIGRFFGAVPVGLYRQAQQLLMVPVDQLNAPITAMAQPALAALQDDPERYRRYYDRVTFLVALATVPLGVIVAVYAREIAHVVLGEAWGQAAGFIRIFGVAAAIRPAVATSAVVLITCGHSARYLRAAIAHSLLLAVLMCAGLSWGAEGVAIAHVSATVIALWPKLWYSFLDTPVSVRLFVRSVRVPVLAGLATGAAALALHRGLALPDAPGLVAGAVLGSAVYLAACLVQGEGRRRIRALVDDLRAALRRRAATSAA